MNSHNETHNKILSNGSVAVVGFVYDKQSSYMQGPALAPAAIRAALHCDSSNLCAENRVDLGNEIRFVELDDLMLNDISEPFGLIEKTVAHILEQNAYVLALGGDHSITYPILRAYRNAYPALTVVHLDAHPDIYDHFEGNRYSHACPFARIMEEQLTNRLIQVGIRTLNPHQRRQTKKFGVEVIEMKDWHPECVSDIAGPVYLSLDMDVLDPAFAPGVSHHEPGGLSTRDVIQLIHSIPGPIVGADIVEYNPKRDLVNITAMAAAKFLKEIAGKMIGKTNF